jgi:hypothetical protein
MPDPGVNVLLNPDWSDRDGTGAGVQARWWHTYFTWEPLLCWGTGSFYTVFGDNALRVLCFDSTQIDPADGYPGILYGGPGFDASPGETWRVSFVASRPAAGGHGGPGQTNDDLFVRVGISVPEGDQWLAYYMNLEVADLNPSSSIGYDVEFEIPSDWPAGQYQFAVCHTGDPTLPSFVYPGTPATSNYLTGFTFDLSDMNLEFVSGGAGSPGPAGVLNPLAHWPVPTWSTDPLWPPPYLTWDSDPVFRAPLLDQQATFGPLPHLGGSDVPLERGWVSFGQPNDLGDPGPIWFRAAPLDPNPDNGGWVNAGGAEFMAIPDYEHFPPFWFPFSPECGAEWEALGAGYWEVPSREWYGGALPPIFPAHWVPTSPWGTIVVPPSWITRHRGAQYLGYLPIPPPEHQFAIENTCEPPPGVGSLPQPIYLTRQVAPGDANIPAGGSGGLNLRGIRAGAGEGTTAATGPPGIDLGGIKGQP